MHPAKYMAKDIIAYGPYVHPGVRITKMVIISVPSMHMLMLDLLSSSELGHHERIPKQHVSRQDVLMLASSIIIYIDRLQDPPFVCYTSLPATIRSELQTKVCYLDTLGLA